VAAARDPKPISATDDRIASFFIVLLLTFFVGVSVSTMSVGFGFVRWHRNRLAI
jgi:hypothetical protein